MQRGELDAALGHYRALCASVPLKPIRTKKDYRRAVAVLNELPAGKRQVNARQARALGKRFGVPPGVFV